VQSKIATLEEIRRFWDIKDVMAANDILEAMADSDYLYQKSLAGKRKG